MYRVSIELYKHEWKFGRTRNAVGTRAARVLSQDCFLNCIIGWAAFFYKKRKRWRKLPATKYIQMSRRQRKKKGLSQDRAPVSGLHQEK